MSAELPLILILGAASTYLPQAIELAEESGYRVAGVVDNLGVPLRLDRVDIPLYVLRELPASFQRLPAVCCVGTPEYRRRVVAEAAEVGITQFSTLLHPKAYVSRTAQMGLGCIMSPLTFIGAYAHFGDHVLVRGNTVVGHNSTVGDYVTIGPGVMLGGLVSIDSGVFIGIGAKILPRVHIGANSVVASGAVVTGDVGANTLAAGAPARIAKTDIPGYRGS